MTTRSGNRRQIKVVPFQSTAAGWEPTQHSMVAKDLKKIFSSSLWTKHGDSAEKFQLPTLFQKGGDKCILSEVFCGQSQNCSAKATTEMKKLFKWNTRQAVMKIIAIITPLNIDGCWQSWALAQFCVIFLHCFRDNDYGDGCNRNSSIPFGH